MSIVADLPKAELHLHLEGSVEPETLLELVPEATPEQVRAMYQYADFAGFIESFKWVVTLLRKPEDYALVTRRLLARLERENVKYAEITLSAGVVLWKKQNLDEVHHAIREAATASGVQVYWIFDAIRHLGAAHVLSVAEEAARFVDHGVVAFGIGGDEARGPAEWSRDAFALARSAGLRLVAHAGETTGPESVREALEIGAERIGHGIRAAEDPALMRLLAERDIPLEVCVSSNVATGAVSRLEEHPLRRLFDAGVPIVLNTDDPAMFHTTLTREYEIARRHFGFSGSELAALARNSLRYAFRYNEHCSTDSLTSLSHSDPGA
jgi:aminodeoxyfutalosine deaminase